MRRSTVAGLFLLFTAGVVLRLGYCHFTRGLGQPGIEGFREYVVAAQRLLDTGVLSSPLIAQPEAARAPSDLLPPVYVGVVAAAFKLWGVETFAAILALQVLNAAATSLAAVLAFLIGRKLAGECAGWIAGLVALLHPGTIGYTNYIWDTALFTLAATWTVWLSLRLADGPLSGRRCLWFGLALGAVALLNPAWTAAYPLLVLWPLARRGEWSRPKVARAVGLAVAGWALAIAPWTARNCVQVGEWSYIRGGLGLELWLGVCPEVDGVGRVYENRFPSFSDAEQRRITAMGERAYVRECQARAWAAIQADPWRYLRLCAWRAVDFWGGTIFTHTDPGRNRWPQGLVRAGLMAWMAAEVGAIGVLLWIVGGIPRDLRWLLGMVAIFSVLYCLTHVELRFRAPVAPLLAVLVACSAVLAQQRRRAAKTSPTAVSAAASRISQPQCMMGRQA